MRALLAGIFVFGVTGATVVVISSHSPNNDLPSWGTPVVLLTMFVAIIGAFFIFNSGSHRSRKAARMSLDELREKGLLISETFKARRAFEVEEFEDEGSHFFIELEDGSVLCLEGQYLYDCRETIDGKQTFPSSEFTLSRNKTTGFILAVTPGGHPLPIECVAPPFNDQETELPEDGEIYRDRSYDELKKERLEKGSR